MTDLVTSNDKLGDRRTLGLLIERNPLPALLFDPQWLGVIAANAAAVSQYGYSKDEFRRLTMNDIVCDADVGAFLRAIEPGARHGDRPPRCRHRRRDGSLLTIECRTDRLEFGGQSAILAIVEGIDGASDLTGDLALNGCAVVEAMHANGAYVVAEAPA